MENTRSETNVRSPLMPPDGYYSVWSPDGVPKLTHWRLEGRTLSEWPIGAKYGPTRPPYMPDVDPEVRRARMAAWRSARRGYLVMVYDAISADPRGAAQAFTRWTGRCQSCKANLTVDDCQPDAPPGSARAAAERLVAGAIRGTVDDAAQLLDGADPAVVIARLSGVISALAGAR
jgi:hypothetical protein